MTHSELNSILPDTLKTAISIVLVVGLAVEMALTWPLWVPISTDFPAVTIWGTSHTPSMRATGVTAMFMLSLVWTLYFPFRIEMHQRLCWLLMLTMLAFLISLDVHRFQPWLWHTVLLTTAMSVNQSTSNQDSWNSLRWGQWIAISIYFYSAVSKFDHYFLFHQGDLLLAGFFKATHFNDTFLTDQIRLLLKLMFPTGEMLTAVLLVFRSSRIAGLVMATGLHVGLLITLGPLGLNHNPPVLVWNICFLLTTWLCFAVVVPTHRWSFNFRNWRTLDPRSTLLGLAMMFPALEWFGCADAWPAWCLYSARQGTGRIALKTNEQMTARLSAFTGPQDTESWESFDFYQWSFAETGAPVYPASRYTIALGRWLATQSGVEQVRVVIGGPPNRLTGQQDYQESEFVHQR